MIQQIQQIKIGKKLPLRSPTPKWRANLSYKVFVNFFMLSVFISPILSSAQEVGRSYRYESINASYTIQDDSTVLVEEVDTYRFQGEYHQGWREIALRRIGSITDISVVDSETGMPLSYSSARLEKTNPASWGSYTTFRQDGKQIIEWYYDAKDVTRTWIIRYRLHGAISFLDNHDELYWNIFTDFSVPVDAFEASVRLKRPLSGTEQFTNTLYTEPTGEQYGTACENYPDRTGVVCRGFGMPEYAKVTVAVGWPKGIVQQSAFWKDFLKTNIFWFLSILITLGTIVLLIYRWYVTERRGIRTIVAEYEPPVGMSPAFAETIIKERLTPKAWSATLVDLAIRGFLEIKEDTKNLWGIGIRAILLMIPVIIFIIFDLPDFLMPQIFMLIVIIFIFSVSARFLNKSSIIQTDYIISRTAKVFERLAPYEKSFMDTLIPFSEPFSTFSTKAMRKSPESSRALYKKMKELEDEFYKEIEKVTGLYAVPISGEKMRNVLLIFCFLFLIFLFFGPHTSFESSTITLFFVLTTYIFIFVYSGRYEARLNEQGMRMKEKLLGFKLYLATAEKYRMQNLTPELFEKYLPYAIVFGVEKKWGRAFEGIAVPPPTWYHSSGGFNAGVGGTSNVSAFSASAFSSSIGSSFASAMSSSGGGGGASGGGGGAGGGGGGGGGGAS